MNGILLALDPSIRSCGVALFRGGKLARADALELDTDGDIAARCLRAGLEIAEWCLQTGNPAGDGAVPRTLVVEWPQWYAGPKAKGDPNDLAGLAGVAGAAAGVLSLACRSRDWALKVVSYKPAEWAGQLPKKKTGSAWKSVRGLRVLGALSGTEVDACRNQHDAVDAVGLGLYHLGRFERRRVFEGATE
jgi:hypothetical protein